MANMVIGRVLATEKNPSKEIHYGDSRKKHTR